MPALGAACAVDENVDAAQNFDGTADRRRQRFGLCEIDVLHVDPDLRRSANLLRHLLALRNVARKEPEMDSLDRERLCDPGTDATIGTSDEGDAIFEAQFHMISAVAAAALAAAATIKAVP